MDKLTRIGIMGGSFDPIHLGHVLVAEQMRDARGLQRIIFVPSYVPPHKLHRRLVPAKHRLRMVELALADFPDAEVSTIELDRQGTSYSIDTLSELREELGEGHRMCFIIGSDTLAELSTWRRPCDLVEQADFLTAVRPNTTNDFWDELSFTFSPEQIDRLKKGRVNTIPIGISSTDIRRRVREGRSIRFLVPPAVEDYIYRHGLYK